MSQAQRYPRDWEPANLNTSRIRVPGGWIVRSFTQTITGGTYYVNSESMVFIKDEDKLWELEKE